MTDEQVAYAQRIRAWRAEDRSRLRVWRSRIDAHWMRPHELVPVRIDGDGVVLAELEVRLEDAPAISESGVRRVEGRERPGRHGTKSRGRTPRIVPQKAVEPGFGTGLGVSIRRFESRVARREGGFVTVSLQLSTGMSAGYTPFERRCAPRIATRLPVRLHCQGMEVGLRATTRDLGSGGVCVETPSPFALASLRSIEITLPENRSLHFAAEGLWQRDAASGSGVLTGVAFQGAGSDEEAQIDEFVITQAKRLADFFRRESDLRELAIDDALDLAFCTRFADYPAGGVVYAQDACGMRTDSYFVVSSGSIVLEAKHPGSLGIHIHRVGVGGILCGTSLLAQHPNTESAVAESDTTLLEIDSYTLHYLGESKPGVCRTLYQNLLRSRSVQLEQVVRRLADEQRRAGSVARASDEAEAAEE